MLTTRSIATLSDQFHADLSEQMPGCDVRVFSRPRGYRAVATHRITGRAVVVNLIDDEWVVTYPGSRTTGSSAYGYDSAVVHAYRHYLDYTPEHGPGTAYDYAQVAS